MSTHSDQTSAIESLARRLNVPRRRIDQAIGLILFGICWEIGAYFGGPLLPTLTETLPALVELFTSGVIFEPLSVTLQKMLIGFGLALIVALPIGLIMGFSRKMKFFLDSYVNIMFVTSVSSLLPFLIVMFGTRMGFFVSVVFLFAVFHMILNFQAGVEDVNEELVEAARVFGVDQKQVYRHVLFPAALPFIIAGIRIGISRSFRGIIVAELWVYAGIGQLLAGYQQSLRSDYVLAIIIALVLLSVFLVRLLYFIEKKLAPWREITDQGDGI